MKILFFTDCMSHSPADLDISLRYPFLLKQCLENRLNCSVIVNIVSGRGATTFEALEQLKEIQEQHDTYDVVVFAYGINDALPRGLTRDTRGRLIRFMFTCRLPKQLRLMCRYFFLNPLEYLMQCIRKPRFYNDVETFVKNVDYLMEQLTPLSPEKPLYLSANPVLNYRFIKANHYIKSYNDKVIKFLADKGYSSVDMFNVFQPKALKTYLAEDKFHYGALGHQAVANAIMEYMEEVQLIPKANQ